MLTLYKYMPFSTLLKFMDDPCLRVTPCYCQNDPFEFGYTSQDIDQLNEKSGNRKLGNGLQDYSKLHGIVSLCSSKSDVLMWTHYADKHKGAVVEFHLDRENPQSLFVNSTGYLPPSDFYFDKVNYKKERHFPELEKPIDMDALIDAVRKHYYFTKAKQWKIEQEYRFIIPFTWINRILFSEKGYQKALKILDEFPKLISCLHQEDNNNPNKTYELSMPEIIIVKKPQALLQLWIESDGADIMFFIRLNRRQICRVYLGCLSNVEDFVSYLRSHRHGSHSISEKYHDLYGNSLHIHRGRIDDNEYKIVFQKETFCIYDHN